MLADEGWCARVEGPALALDFRSKVSDSPSGAIGLLSTGWRTGPSTLYMYALFWGGLGPGPGCFTAVLLYHALLPDTAGYNDATVFCIRLHGSARNPLRRIRSIRPAPLHVCTSRSRWPGYQRRASKALLTQLNLVRMGNLDHHLRLAAL